MQARSSSSSSYGGEFSNVSYLEVLKTVIASSPFLLPANIPHREVIAEGCYSLSHLLTSLYEAIQAKAQPDAYTALQFSNLQQSLHLLTRCVSQVEVFLELASKALLPPETSSLIVLLIEGIKAASRLACLLTQSKTYMITDWERKGPSKHDLHSYLGHYQQEFERQIRTLLISPHFLLPMETRFGIGFEAAQEQSSARSFTGKRSGLQINLKSGLVSVLDHHQQQHISSDDSTRGLSQSASTEYPSNKGIHHMQRIKHDPLTPHHLLVNTITNLSDFNTPLRESSTASNTANTALPPIMEGQSLDMREDIDSPSGMKINEAASSPSLVENAQSFTTEQKMFVGELLYTLRPVIYALILHSIQQGAKKESANESVQDVIASSSDSLLNLFGNVSSEMGVYNKSKKVFQTFLNVILPKLDKETAWKALALLISFIIEFASIQLSARALFELRQQGKALALAQSIRELAASRQQVGEPRNTPLIIEELKERFNEDSQAVVNEGFVKRPSALHSYDLEIQRRRMALYFYLLRSPLFDRTTLPATKMVCQVLKQIPLVGSLSHYALDLLVYLNKTHFYNSNS